MKKTIIVVSGKTNTGKTKTLSKLCHCIEAAGGNTSNNIHKHKDYLAWFNYSQTVVGVQTYGDRLRDVENGLAALIKHQCEIIVIASRSQGATIRHIMSFAKMHGFRPIRTTTNRVKADSIPYEDMNSYTSRQLLSMVDDIIAGTL